MIPELANNLRSHGYDVFDDWHAAGPTADDHWQQYEQQRDRPYNEALRSYPAEHTWNYDVRHLNRCSMAVLVLPAGKSGHLELGFAIGLGKPGFILLDKTPERWDVMYRFATVCFTQDELLDELRKNFHIASEHADARTN